MTYRELTKNSVVSGTMNLIKRMDMQRTVTQILSILKVTALTLSFAVILGAVAAMWLIALLKA